MNEKQHMLHYLEILNIKVKISLIEVKFVNLWKAVKFYCLLQKTIKHIMFNNIYKKKLQTYKKYKINLSITNIYYNNFKNIFF